MTTFTVWAPDAKEAAILIQGEKRFPMMPLDHGWWMIDLPEAGHGTDYQYILDGGEPLPDPRSQWQPDGCMGPSRVVDHNLYEWFDQGFQAVPLAAAVIYELHIGTFTPEGTFDAAIEKLDHLHQLGVTHVELMPVAEFPGRCNWGYDSVHPFAPHEGYGGPDGLKHLVDACHRRGIAVILDVIYNHLGPGGEFITRFGPYLNQRYRTPWGDAVNLDGPGSDQVRQYFIDNAVMWMRDYHIDGLRLDAVHTMLDSTAVHFLEKLARETRKLENQTGRRRVLIAESDLNDPRLVRSQESGGYGLDAQWNDDFHHAVHALLTGERAGVLVDFGSIEQVAKALSKGFVIDGQWTEFRQRSFGRPAEGIPASRFVAFLQNHDQVGNRATGERNTQYTNTPLLEIAQILLFCAPYAPMLFMGEEWGASTPFLYFTDHPDPEFARLVRDGRRKEFEPYGWNPEDVPDPQDPSTFRQSKLNWGELEDTPHAGMLEWHKKLIALRRSLPDLASGTFDNMRVRFDEFEGWLYMRRGRVGVAVNISEHSRKVTMNREICTVLLSTEPNVQFGENTITLPPQSGVIFEVSQ